MGTLWIPGADRLKPSLPGGTITSTAPPRVVWHTTEAPPGTDNMFATMIRVLTNKSAEPQVLYDPVTDRLGQFMPLNTSGRALKNDGAYRTNRTGRVCIQIEVIGYAAKPFTSTWKPGPNYRALMAAIRSWGIPDVFPMGNPPKYPGASRRDRNIWLSKAGHYCHANVPGNDHGDPGAISPTKLFAAAPKATTDVTPRPPASTEDDMPLTTADLDAVQARAYKANSDYAVAFWVSPNGTGTAIRNLLAAMKVQLDRIEDDVDGAAATQALLEKLDANVEALRAEAQADNPKV